MLGPGGRPRRMISLGKVSAPKPINLPSQRKENNGNDPSIDLVRKSVSGTWGSQSTNAVSPSVSSGNEAATAAPAAPGAAPVAGDTASSVAPQRVIPAGPSPAWGGLGLPDERRRVAGGAGHRERQFPQLGADPLEHEADSAAAHERPPHWTRDERGYDDYHGHHHHGGEPSSAYRGGPDPRWAYENGDAPYGRPPPAAHRDVYYGDAPRPQGRRVIESQDFRNAGAYVADRYVPAPPRSPRAAPLAVVPPPPPPPRRPAALPEREREREESSASEDSRLATAASSLPRSDLSVGAGAGGDVTSTAGTAAPPSPGSSVAGEGRTLSPRLSAGPRLAPQPPPRILKRPESPPATVPAPAPGPQLPSQASLLDHISSPQQPQPFGALPHHLRGVGPQPALVLPQHPGLVPYVSAPGPDPSVFPGTTVWQPPMPMAAPQQAPGPLMTFGAAPPAALARLPDVSRDVPGYLPPAAAPAAAPAAPAPQPVVSPAAEAQSAFMRAKAAEKAQERRQMAQRDAGAPPKRAPKKERREADGGATGAGAGTGATGPSGAPVAQKLTGGGRVLELRRPVASKPSKAPKPEQDGAAGKAEGKPEAKGPPGAKPKRGARAGRQSKAAGEGVQPAKPDEPAQGEDAAVGQKKAGKSRPRRGGQKSGPGGEKKAENGKAPNAAKEGKGGGRPAREGAPKPPKDGKQGSGAPAAKEGPAAAKETGASKHAAKPRNRRHRGAAKAPHDGAAPPREPQDGAPKAPPPPPQPTA